MFTARVYYTVTAYAKTPPTPLPRHFDAAIDVTFSAVSCHADIFTLRRAIDAAFQRLRRYLFSMSVIAY